MIKDIISTFSRNSTGLQGSENDCSTTHQEYDILISNNENNHLSIAQQTNVFNYIKSLHTQVVSR